MPRETPEHREDETQILQNIESDRRSLRDRALRSRSRIEHPGLAAKTNEQRLSEDKARLGVFDTQFRAQ
jgi:hypothetical protein